MTLPGKGLSAALLIALLAAAAVLIFARLDNMIMWEDECETALLGVNILKFGLPYAYDGEMVISQEWGREFGKDYLWRWTPWLDKYIAAASIRLFGKNTFAARLPFTMIGLISVWLTFVVCRYIFQDEAISLVGTSLITFSVPFILFARQCRYYAVMTLGTLLAVWSFFALMRGRRRAAAAFVVSSIILFHSNAFSFLAALFSLFLAFFIFFFDHRDYGALKRVSWTCLAAFAINFPAMIFFMVFKRGGELERLRTVAYNLVYYLKAVHWFAFPFLLLAVFIAFLAHKKEVFDKWKAQSGREFSFLFCFCLSYIVCISFLPWNFFRYMVNLLPVFAMLTSCMLCAMVRSKIRWALWAIAAVALIHFLRPEAIWPEWQENFLRAGNFKQLLPNYIYEITHDYAGPLKKIISYLNGKAKKDDTIFVSYGDLVVKFYTDLDVFGGQTGIDISKRRPPDWIFGRCFFCATSTANAERHAYENLTVVNSWIKGGDYDRVEFIDTPDLVWENRSDPFYHRFKTPSPEPGIPNVALFKKR